MTQPIDPTTDSYVKAAASGDKNLYGGIFEAAQEPEPERPTTVTILLEGPTMRVVHVAQPPRKDDAASLGYHAVIVEGRRADALGRPSWFEISRYDDTHPVYGAITVLAQRRSTDRQNMQDLVRVAVDRARTVLASAEGVADELATLLDHAGEPGDKVYIIPLHVRTALEKAHAALDDSSDTPENTAAYAALSEALSTTVPHMLNSKAPDVYTRLRENVGNLRGIAGALGCLIDGAHMMILGDVDIGPMSPEGVARAVISGKLEVQTHFAWYVNGGGR